MLLEDRISQYQELIGKNISQIMSAKSITQDKLHALCLQGGYNISQSTISNAKNGKCNLTLSNLVAIAYALEVNVTDLLATPQSSLEKTSQKENPESDKGIEVFLTNPNSRFFQGYLGSYHVLFYKTSGSGNESGDGGEDNSDDVGWFSRIVNGILDLPNRILEGLASSFEDFKESLTNIGNFFADLLSYINPFSENFILKDVVKFLGDMLSYINPFSENFILKGVLQFLGDMLSYINPFSENFFGKKLVELIGDLLKLLFVPSEESINNLVDTVKSKFRFVDTISNTSKLVEDMFKDKSTLPKLTLTLNNNKWYSGEITVIDLSWYAPYKSYGDTIISAFIYVFFLWRIFIKLPGIVSGSAGGVSDIIHISRKGE